MAPFMNNGTFTSITGDELAAVCGGSARDKVVLQGLDAKFGGDGVVSLVGHPKYTSTGTSGVSRVRGTVDINALWGGDTKRTFRGTVDMNTHTLSGLHTKILSQE